MSDIDNFNRDFENAKGLEVLRLITNCSFFHKFLIVSFLLKI